MRHFIRIAITGSLALAGCRDSPTQPSQPMAPELTITISGTLAATANLVSTGEAALLFDGTEVAHQTCRAIACQSLDFYATRGSSRGAHTVEVQLIRQTCDLLPCSGSSSFMFSGTATVSKAGSVTQQISLDPQTRPLNRLDKISYSIVINP